MSRFIDKEDPKAEESILGWKKRIFSIDKKRFVSGDPNLITEDEFLINKLDSEWKVAIRENGILKYLTCSNAQSDEGVLYLGTGFKTLSSIDRSSLKGIRPAYNMSRKPLPCYFYIDVTGGEGAGLFYPAIDKCRVYIMSYNWYIVSTTIKDNSIEGITDAFFKEAFGSSSTPREGLVLRDTTTDFDALTYLYQTKVFNCPAFFAYCHASGVGCYYFPESKCISINNNSTYSQSVIVTNNLTCPVGNDGGKGMFLSYTPNEDWAPEGDGVYKGPAFNGGGVIMIDPRVDMIYRVVPTCSDPSIYEANATVDGNNNSNKDSVLNIKDADYARVTYDLKIIPLDEYDFSEIRKKYGFPKLDRSVYEAEDAHLLDNRKVASASEDIQIYMSKITWYNEQLKVDK